MGKKIEFRPPPGSKRRSLSEAEKERLAQEFIADAPLSSSSQALPAKNLRPWELLEKPDRRIQQFKLRLPSEQFQQLQYLSKETNTSINSIIVNLLRPALRKAIKDINLDK